MTKSLHQRAEDHGFEGTVPKLNIDLGNVQGASTDLSHIRVLSDRKMKLTVDRAYAYVGLPQLEDERKVRQPHVDFLRRQMKMKTFNWDNVIIATALFEGKEYALNGQHTSWSVILNNKAGGNVRYIRYKVRNKDEMAALYQTYDPYSSTRTNRHLTRMAVSGVTGFETIWASLRHVAANACLWWQLPVRQDRISMTPPEKATIAEAHAKTVAGAMAIVQRHCNDFTPSKRTSVVAAIMATYDKAPKKAEEFWDFVLSGLNLPKKTDPVFKLRKFLNETIIDGATRSGKKPVTTEDAYCTCIACWNKWRKGEEMRSMPRVFKKRPVATR